MDSPFDLLGQGRQILSCHGVGEADCEMRRRLALPLLLASATLATDVTNPLLNPYLSSLDGLSLKSPVQAFFDFCREREAIRFRRESGAPAPWSSDVVFQRGRFLNVFREDDRSTKSILRFVERSLPQGASDDSDLRTLLHALFFARWCNRDSTLDEIVDAASFLSGDPAAARDALERTRSPPWSNVAAYPVGPVQWRGRSYSRLDAATALFADPACLDFVAEAIRRSGGSVLEATATINAVFQMDNDFPIFMAAMDVAWFRPDLIAPASEVPVGIGAIPFLRLLQDELGAELSWQEVLSAVAALQPTRWPEAKRPLQPIDVEYLCCECRKYHSYAIGSKSFEGKNVFVPGVSPMLSFDDVEDIEEAAAHGAGGGTGGTAASPVYVIAGAPGSGKSSLVSALQAGGHRVVPKTAEVAIRQGIAEGRTAEELRRDPVAWQLELLQRDYALFESLFRSCADGAAEPVFADTSFVETVVFSRRAGLTLGPRAEAWLRAPQRRYGGVFLLAPLCTYEETDVRRETRDLAAEISGEVRAAYERLGYDPVVVPPLPLEERVQFILSVVGGASTPD